MVVKKNKAFVFFQSGQLALAVKSSPANARDLRDRVPSQGQEDPDGEGNGYPLQYFYL